ncbi:MAG: DNA-processing protein DprA [Actinomycetota bacterium]|nr:DNA-processing protein DprA [Actinomycetota bacterium]
MTPCDVPARGTRDEADVLARAALSHVAEPGRRDVSEMVAAYSAAPVWVALRSGQWPDARPAPRELVARAEGVEPDRALERLHALGGRLVCPGDDEWPEQLHVLELLDRPDHCVPLALWVRGRHRLDTVARRSAAVVGARAASAYGQHVAGELAASLAERDCAVVSGGAYGIDGAAHRGALAVDGVTVAVLASGVDVPYPTGHDSLFTRIAAEGLLVSEWPPGTTPMRHRFLVRNRLIAALSGGTVVVEAAVRSGALSTARLAEALLRPVMAVPGPVTSVMSSGCHLLVRSGAATLVTCADDVLELVGSFGVDVTPELRAQPTRRDLLPPAQRAVLEALPARRALSVGRIAVLAGVPVPEALGCLGLLRSQGLVEQTSAGWRLARNGGAAGSDAQLLLDAPAG